MEPLCTEHRRPPHGLRPSSRQCLERYTNVGAAGIQHPLQPTDPTLHGPRWLYLRPHDCRIRPRPQQSFGLRRLRHGPTDCHRPMGARHRRPLTLQRRPSIPCHTVLGLLLLLCRRCGRRPNPSTLHCPHLVQCDNRYNHNPATQQPSTDSILHRNSSHRSTARDRTSGPHRHIPQHHRLPDAQHNL